VLRFDVTGCAVFIFYDIVYVCGEIAPPLSGQAAPYGEKIENHTT